MRTARFSLTKGLVKFCDVDCSGTEGEKRPPGKQQSSLAGDLGMHSPQPQIISCDGLQRISIPNTVDVRVPHARCPCELDHSFNEVII